MTLAGNPRHIKNHPAQCTAVTAKLYVRCCSPSGGKVKMCPPARPAMQRTHATHARR